MPLCSKVENFKTLVFKVVPVGSTFKIFPAYHFIRPCLGLYLLQLEHKVSLFFPRLISFGRSIGGGSLHIKIS